MNDVCLNSFGLPSLICRATRQKIVIPYIKLMLLIAYLALEPRVHTREFLADLFWPNFDVSDARANLRRALFNIRQACEKAGFQHTLIHADRCTISLSQEYFWADVLQFGKGAKAGLTTTIELKLSLYKGAFMEGIHPTDETLANWVQNKRTEYEQQYISLLEKAVVHTAGAGNFEATKKFCRQLIVIDNLNEMAHLYLIRMSIQCGALVAARKIYNAYCQTIDLELGMPPSQQLKAIVGLD